MADPVQHLSDVAHAEADAYRGDEDIPLGGYAVSLTTYVVVVAIGGLIVRRRGLPKHVSWGDLVLGAVATHKVSRTVAKDSVTSPLRAPFTRFERPGGPAEHMEAPRGHGVRKAIGSLLSCPFCLDQWVATGFAFGFVLAPRATRFVAGVFAVVTGSDFLQLAYARMQPD